MTRLSSLSAAVALVAALALPRGAGAQDTQGPDTLRETFRDWTVQCAATEAGGRICEMAQTIRHDQSGGTLLQFALQIGEAGAVRGVMIAPFGLRLSQGLRLRVGEADIGNYGFDTCLSSGCIALAVFDEQAVSQMQAGSSGQVRATARNGETLAIPVSFMGFSAGLARLRALSQG